MKHELIIGERGSDSNHDEGSEVKRGAGDKVNVDATRD